VGGNAVTTLPEKLHAELGASVAKRWMSCPGSVRLARGQPNYESEHSRAGTAAHAVAEMALNRGLPAGTWLGTQVEGVEVDHDMVEAVSVFVDYCRTLMNKADRFGIEQRFSLAALNPPGQMFGTADFWALAQRILDVADYKNGSGVVVEVKDNPQLKYYALGVLLSLPPGTEVDEIRITIVQPNAAHPEGVVRSDTISYPDLLAFAGELMDAARATLDPNAPLNAGSHCRFCPASAICPAQRDQVQALAQVAFADMPLDVPPPPGVLTSDDLGDFIAKLPILEQWAKDVRAEGLRRLEAGETIPGLKLVQKRATRQWVSPEETQRWLIDDQGFTPEEVFDMKLKSPAQVEVLLNGGKKTKAKSRMQLPEDMVESKSSGYTLAASTDKRPAVALAAQDVFEALPSGE
jgi:hypothetical protein